MHKLILLLLSLSLLLLYCVLNTDRKKKKLKKKETLQMFYEKCHQQQDDDWLPPPTPPTASDQRLEMQIFSQVLFFSLSCCHWLSPTKGNMFLGISKVFDGMPLLLPPKDFHNCHIHVCMYCWASFDNPSDDGIFYV